MSAVLRIKPDPNPTAADVLAALASKLRWDGGEIYLGDKAVFWKPDCEEVVGSGRETGTEAVREYGAWVIKTGSRVEEFSTLQEALTEVVL